MSNKIRIIKNEYPLMIGDVIEPDMIGVAQLYVERGIAEWVTDEPKPFPPPNKMVKARAVKQKAA